MIGARICSDLKTSQTFGSRALAQHRILALLCCNFCGGAVAHDARAGIKPIA